MEKVRVFLADWQVLFREGVHLALCAEESYEVIGEAATNEGALDFIENNRPGVAILNADHGEPTGIEITRRIKQNLPTVAIILMMDSYRDEQVFAALKSGASACLSKDVELDELHDTIRRVVQGEYPINQSILKPAVASRILSEFETVLQLNGEPGNLPARLLSLEIQILKHIASGNRLENIARDMNITEDTVRQRLYIILGKLVTNDRNNRLIDVGQGNSPPMPSKSSGIR